ncbi:MAG: glycosyltransferase [Bacteroidales bacterium]
MQNSGKKYDYLFLSGTPSFYKTNLFNEIGRSARVLVLYCGYFEGAVNSDVKQLEKGSFEYIFLHNGDIAKRNKVAVFMKLLHITGKISCRRIIHEGWYVPEYCLYAFLSPKSKNVTVCESTIFESNFSGIKSIIKKLIINRSSIALPSGYAHNAIFTKAEYKGVIKITGGVGIINKHGNKMGNTGRHSPIRYLYVGRLTECKNLSFLIDCFNKSGKPLTITGNGELMSELETKAKKNISFTGFIGNDRLPEIYTSHDVLLLPSKKETWGLVVEEAIYWGLPVIVSNHVGCSTDMVQNIRTGIIFDINNEDSFNNSIADMEANYERYKSNVDGYDLDAKDKKQVETYLSL